MFPHEINQIAFDGYRKVVADACGRSLGTVDHWCLAPDGSGDSTPSPIERLLSSMLALRAAGAPGWLLPLEYLCSELGFLPLIRADVAVEPASLTGAADLMREAAEAITEEAAIAGEERPTLEAVERLDKELADIQRVCARERFALQRLIHGAEQGIARERIGPRRALPRFIQLRSASA